MFYKLWNEGWFKMSKRPEPTWRERRKEEYERFKPKCEFYRDMKRCYLQDGEFCIHDGNNNVCRLYKEKMS